MNEKVQDRIKNLVDIINKANYNYHVLDNPEISDQEYDKYLTYLYGDYMQMIPVSQRKLSHSIVLMDLGEYVNFKIN